MESSYGATDKIPDSEDSNHDKDKNVTVESGSSESGSSRNKIVPAVLLCLAGFSQFTCVSLVGPAMMDLQLLTSSTLTSVSWLLSGRAAGGIAGLMLLGCCVNHQISTLWTQLSVFSVISAVFFGYSTWTAKFGVQLACFVFYGFLGTFVLTGSGIAVHRLFDNPKESTKWFSISQLFIYFGGFIGPFFVRPYLSEYTRLSIENRTSEEGNHSQLYTSGFHPIPHPYTSVTYGFTAATILVFYTGIVMFLMGAFLRGVNFHSVRKEEHGVGNRSQNKRRCFIVLLMLFSFVQSQYTRGLISFLPVFVVEFLGWTKSTGAVLTSVAFLSFAIFRFLNIFFRIKPVVQLFFGLLLSTVASVLLSVLSQYHNSVVWVCTVLLGLGCGAVLTSKLAWIGDSYGDTNNMAVASAVANLAGEVVFSPVIAYLLENVSFVSLLYLTTASTATNLALVILMHVITKQYMPNSDNKQNFVEAEKQPLLSEPSFA